MAEGLNRIEFTPKMRDEYTILIPNMAPIHFELMRSIFRLHGYKVEILQEETESAVEAGLRYVHNDICYPAIVVIGQFMRALESGKYDNEKTALMLYQTGGGCRASNYVHLLRKALAKSGFEKVPVISLCYGGIEKNSGFKITMPMLRMALTAWLYADMLMLLKNQVIPYEARPGESQRLTDKWVYKISGQFKNQKGLGKGNIRKNLAAIAADFASVRIIAGPSRIKVGIVGELYVKYSAVGNNNLESFLVRQGCEVMVPGLLGFAFYSLNIEQENKRLYGTTLGKLLISRFAVKYLSRLHQHLIDALGPYPRFTAPAPFSQLKKNAEGIIGLGMCMGEGWLLPAEMVELIELGYCNIVCTQPFGCLPNHICGKGEIRRLSELMPGANIVAIDYDPGAARVNQENRIRLMLAVAKEKAEANRP